MIYCLGPAGSYTGKATKIFSKSINDNNIIYCESIYEVFEYVDKYKDIENNEVYGVVPSENSIEGSVSLTQDLLLEFPVKILGELDIRIHHCLIGYDKNKIIKKPFIEKVFGSKNGHNVTIIIVMPEKHNNTDLNKENRALIAQ